AARQRPHPPLRQQPDVAPEHARQLRPGDERHHELGSPALSWDPNQYERFKDERAQPFRDLAALVEHRPHMRVADLGCGTGELTRELHEQLSAEETLGIDNSESMLRKAKPSGTLRFELADIANFASDRPFDLIFSNAALHWVPDHEHLF